MPVLELLIKKLCLKPNNPLDNCSNLLLKVTITTASCASSCGRCSFFTLLFTRVIKRRMVLADGRGLLDTTGHTSLVEIRLKSFRVLGFFIFVVRDATVSFALFQEALVVW